MSVRRTIPSHDGVFFITITCVQWLNLFEISNSYNAVYRWFDYLRESGHYVTGYVVMPNHLHCLVAFSNTKGKSINKIIGNGKRFMAYYIVDCLEEMGRFDTLETLNSRVSLLEQKRNKIHEVFEPSFDWKECWTEKFIVQKLDYMHLNLAVNGIWHNNIGSTLIALRCFTPRVNRGFTR